MCFNIYQSLILFILGSYISIKLYNKSLYYKMMIILYYTLMELVQTLGYLYIDQCETNINFALTICSHILVIFQPFLWNFYRTRTNSNKTIFNFSCILSLIWSFIFTYRLFYGKLGYGVTYGYLDYNEINVGDEYCMLNGVNHIIWKLPYKSSNGLEPNYFTYLLLWFVPAIYEDYYGYYKLLFWLIQVNITNIISGSVHELSSIWCLFSIPYLCFYFYKYIL